jgi:hypothetical protein
VIGIPTNTRAKIFSASHLNIWCRQILLGFVIWKYTPF